MIGKTSNLEQEKKEINELKKHVGTLREDLARMDELIRSDYGTFVKERFEDLKEGFLNWLKMLVECEQKILDSWQSLSKAVERASV